MSEYWKSTPSYWCKFCSQYVRDTSLERKNHEASARHQNNIQRSLRELHKTKQGEEREKQRAKDEVARLNGMFSGSKAPSSAKQPSAPVQPSAPKQLNAAQQRKAHAEQLAALGVELPEELKKEVTGVGNYQVVNETEVKPVQGGAATVHRSLADILAESKREEETDGKEEEDDSKSNLKRKIEDDDEEIAPKRKAWGSNLKSYPGSRDIEENSGDLDALLSGVKQKKEPEVKTEKTEDGEVVKKEEGEDVPKSLDAVPDVSSAADAAVKQEAGSDAAPAVVFKKRKGKK